MRHKARGARKEGDCTGHEEHEERCAFIHHTARMVRGPGKRHSHWRATTKYLNVLHVFMWHASTVCTRPEHATELGVVCMGRSDVPAAAIIYSNS
jgi:hypothetical protein